MLDKDQSIAKLNKLYGITKEEQKVIEESLI